MIIKKDIYLYIMPGVGNLQPMSNSCVAHQVPEEKNDTDEYYVYLC